MIEYAELRIGNLVMYDNEVVVVDEINKRNAFLVCLDGAMFSNSKPLAEINPIPLTEEWLLKFGFERSDDEEFDKYANAKTFFKKFMQVGIRPSDSGYAAKIVWFVFGYGMLPEVLLHVHQLQNLFYALTGTELKEEHIEAEQKNEFNPNGVSPPGDTISDWLKERKMSHAEFAEKMRMPVMDLLMGITPIDNLIADKLEAVTGFGYSFWLNRERHYREGLAKGLSETEINPKK